MMPSQDFRFVGEEMAGREQILPPPPLDRLSAVAFLIAWLVQRTQYPGSLSKNFEPRYGYGIAQIFNLCTAFEDGFGPMNPASIDIFVFISARN